ncbi:unannotated protein [freshwater metagenome]|uniref:Unannotated protein n=1 Tax=freshwater metagenome TaxID=449393 RepID=A0A6J6SFE8_9ZZZZ|nr:pilus assembly protein TadG-related protein [Actinomycetota bacterium]MSV64671.1 hypothetical protein [Actinomycetota bacterium]MSW26970.1 hypothetical protein [Actinomycetota bacterium]MSW34780.1 hypothetical protein [Actinomycetota bacterium]MSX31802.1 hypothetical protein [Actinomycetota bacterium]
MAMRSLARKVRANEEGSVSVLIIGLFLITVSLLFVITDVATISVAKQSLVHATESAALRAVQNLDRASYYEGKSGVAVPIDCASARMRVIEELGIWMESSTGMRRPEIDSVGLTGFYCLDNVVELRTTAHAVLPFRLPQSSMKDFEIHASAGAKSDRALQ